MEDLNSRYINIFKEYNKDMGEKDLLLEKIKEEIRRFLERQDVMVCYVSSWIFLAIFVYNYKTLL